MTTILFLPQVRRMHVLALAALAAAAQAQDAEPPLGVNVLESTFKWRPNYVSDDMLLNADKDANNWLHYGKDYQGTRFSALTQITVENVKKLVPKWNLSFGVKPMWAAHRFPGHLRPTNCGRPACRARRQRWSAR